MRREAFPKKCSHTKVEEDPAVVGEGLEKLQLEDQDLRPMVEWMNQSSDGLLQRQWVTTDGLNRNWQTVLPRKMMSEIFREMHNNLTSGHLGEKKTPSFLRQRDTVRLWARRYEEEGHVLTRPRLGRPRVTTPAADQQIQRAAERAPLSTAVHVTYRNRGRRKAESKVVHVNRLWQYQGPGQYTWEDSEEQSLTTDEEQNGDPGRTQYRTDPGNPNMEQEERHCSLLAELDVTGEGDRSKDVT
ncbi:hypothetical protein Hamer_G014905 [Homarus americanus]|uniref:Integrase zinc-binding domain-containing protein n=1 Tax=Homarus americanus TaxID=6706 RepID=A0A8J5JH11_HOMAM|nr:hypothetical protein Hamer_G014905 [Homarus americanus]